MTTFELITSILSVCGIILVLIGVIYSGRQLFLMRQSNDNIHDWNRRKTTYELLKDFARGKYTDLLDELNNMSKLPINNSTNYDMVFKQIEPELHYTFDRKLGQVLNFLEGMAISIKNHIIDEDICFDYAAVIYKVYYNWSKSYIEKSKIELNERSIYIDFENLALKWISMLNERNEKNLKAGVANGKEKLPGKRRSKALLRSKA